VRKALHLAEEVGGRELPRPRPAAPPARPAAPPRRPVRPRPRAGSTPHTHTHPRPPPTGLGRRQVLQRPVSAGAEHRKIPRDLKAPRAALDLGAKGPALRPRGGRSPRSSARGRAARREERAPGRCRESKRQVRGRTRPPLGSGPGNPSTNPPPAAPRLRTHPPPRGGRAPWWRVRVGRWPGRWRSRVLRAPGRLPRPRGPASSSSSATRVTLSEGDLCWTLGPHFAGASSGPRAP